MPAEDTKWKPSNDTRVTIEEEKVLINGNPSTLFRFRVGSAAHQDRLTDDLISQLDLWEDHGINSF